MYLRVSLAVVLLSMSACTLGLEEAEVTADATERGPRPHGEAVLACKASFEERAGSSPSRDAVEDYAACLEAANRLVQPAVEELVREVNASLAAQMDVRLEEYRSDGEKLCKVLARVAASPPDPEAACAVEVERLLADLIDAYVDFEAPPRPIPAARAAHPDCYASFDAAIAEGAERRSAAFDLAVCIENATRLERPLIAMALAESGTENAIQVVDDGFDRVYQQSRAACEIVSAASDARGNSLARLHAATCRVDVAHRIDSLVTD